MDFFSILIYACVGLITGVIIIGVIKTVQKNKERKKRKEEEALKGNSRKKHDDDPFNIN